MLISGSYWQVLHENETRGGIGINNQVVKMIYESERYDQYVF